MDNNCIPSAAAPMQGSGRANKKADVAALHREKILLAAQGLFDQNGFGATTIEDISKASGYSRRTIYAYYSSKEDILQHIAAEGLAALKADIEAALRTDGSFAEICHSIFGAMCHYQAAHPQSAAAVTRASAAVQPFGEAAQRIFALGSEINALLAGFIAAGQQSGAVRAGLDPALTVYTLWACVSGLAALAQASGQYIAGSCNITEADFLDYGCTQILNSILCSRI